MHTQRYINQQFLIYCWYFKEKIWKTTLKAFNKGLVLKRIHTCNGIRHSLWKDEAEPYVVLLEIALAFMELTGFLSKGNRKSKQTNWELKSTLHANNQDCGRQTGRTCCQHTAQKGPSSGHPDGSISRARDSWFGGCKLIQIHVGDRDYLINSS